MCGKRWMVKKDGNRFGSWLGNLETELSLNLYTFI